MTYEAIRDRIADGDLIAVRSTHRGFPWIVRTVTRSPYTHLGLAFWVEGGLWIAEMDGAKHVMVQLSQYDATPFDVFQCPVDRYSVKHFVMQRLRGKIGYDWRDIFAIGMHCLFGFDLPEEDERLQCGAAPVVAYKHCGWQPAGYLPSIPWPGAVVAALAATPILRNDP